MFHRPAALVRLTLVRLTLGLALVAACARAPVKPAPAAAPVAQAPAIRPVEGFDEATNTQLRAFLERTRAMKKRKVAVFDGDGTVFGQVPHYLADECLYRHAQQHPERKPEIIREMQGQSNVSLPYVQNRVRYLAGMTLEEVRDLGRRCFRELYADKMYPPMKSLVALLREHGFEVWIITASPEALYQGFIADELGLAITNVVGVKSVVRDGVVTDQIIHPVPQDEGKKEAIESFVQERPLLAGGNSRGDKEMIEFGSDLKLIVNPDEHVEKGQEQSIADYAKAHGWVVVRIRDVAAQDFPSVTSKVYGVRTNKAHDVPAAGR